MFPGEAFPGDCKFKTSRAVGVYHLQNKSWYLYQHPGLGIPLELV